MAAVAVIGVAGETGLWLADFSLGTLTPLSQPPVGELATAAALRQQGATVIKGVDFGVVVSSAAEVATGHHEP